MPSLYYSVQYSSTAIQFAKDMISHYTTWRIAQCTLIESQFCKHVVCLTRNRAVVACREAGSVCQTLVSISWQMCKRVAQRHIRNLQMYLPWQVYGQTLRTRYHTNRLSYCICS